MSQLPRYESYKDSGVQWLGEIPNHWNVKQLKFAVTCNDEALGENTELDYEILYVDISSVSLTEGIKHKEELLFENAPSRARRVVKSGDVLVSTVRTYLKAITYVESAEENLIASTGFAVLRPSEKFDSKFIGYWIQSEGMVGNIVANSVGVSYPAINSTDLVRLPIVELPLSEQKFIADFLDKRLAQVDALIAKQETLLEKLAEQRVALISHAVTKGLNPTVEMKKTGIKWIGDIPKHWKIMGLKKSLASIVDYRGKTPEKVEQGVFLVTARNIKNGFIDYSLSKEYVEEDLYLDIMSRGLPEIGDVLLTTEAPLGEIAQIDKTDIALAQRIIKFRGKKDVINNTFLKYFMLSRSFQDSLYTYSSGSTAIGIKAERLSYLKVAVPPLEEQEFISNFIAEGVHDIDGMVDKVHQTIQVLREYRSTLITQVVTGKIDVRNLKLN
ncbi:MULTISPECIES: restriction endonuclease subunit S [Acinetobacter]|uniref:Restriction endonuclease subunit S n=1 Tax=Acinetobacter piscicola TaxID=2006115 RepID=A0A7S7AIQ3_9GAMM|nr:MULTISPECIES: restriction endonuclease subunit S [Acinetobacter]QOW47690.1 restriction endonuclease subunit S [Acinetobacter piscicola]